MLSCDLCHITFSEILLKFTNNFVDLFNLQCPKCHKPCQLLLSKYRFLCNGESETKDRRTKKRLRCQFKQSIFKKTFFSRAHLSILKILLFAKLFCYANFSYEVTVSELKISSRTSTKSRHKATLPKTLLSKSSCESL